MTERVPDDLIAEAEIGEAAREFVESELGKCILGMARQEIEAAHMEFEDTKPTDTLAIMSLQNRLWRARAFEQWLCELVDKGNAALSIYRQNTSDN